MVIHEPPRSHRSMLRWALPVVATVTLTGCSTTIDDDKAEKLVTKAARAVGARVKSASCPGDVAAEKGKTFTCDITGADGSTGKVLVAENDDKGNATVRSAFMVPARVERFVNDTVHKQITERTVTSVCPDIVVAKPGGTFPCQVLGGDGSKGTVRVTERDAKGDVVVRAGFVHTGEDERTIAADLERKTGAQSVDVTCPAIVPGKAGQTFECQAVGGDSTATLVVTQVDAKGDIRYRTTG